MKLSEFNLIIIINNTCQKSSQAYLFRISLILTYQLIIMIRINAANLV